MKNRTTASAGRLTIGLNKLKTYFSKPYHVILLLMGIVFTVTTVAHRRHCAGHHEDTPGHH